LDITVEFISGEYSGRKFKFSSSSILVGRSADADLSLPFDIVSYEHCRFTIKADGLYLADLGSSNGTYVNGTRHTSGFISFGDSVAFGENGPVAKIKFSSDGAVQSSRGGSTRAAAKTQMVQSLAKALTLKVKGGKKYEFPPGTIKLGREQECDITLDHPMVSRVHAEISFIPPVISIRDMNSTNGTYLNGKRITSANLKFGDRLMIGENGPQIVVGEGAPIKKRTSSRAFKVILPILVIGLMLFAAYQYIYQPWMEKKRIANQTLQDYVTARLMKLSADLGDPQDEIPLIFVESTVKYVKKFTSNLRGWYENSLKRSELHMGMVRRMLRGAGLPEEFAYLAFVESGYDSTATSPAGARGLWQFMPPTARDFGLRVQKGVIDERIDPKKSTEAACKYIKQLYNLYNSYMLAMASYNTGQGRIANALMRMDVIDQNRFWYLVKNEMLHNETIEYVPKIMAAMIIATDPVKFGFAEEEQNK
jgi:pSer/pThr/pTyr-binding forkhead associated (FHA) protein